MASGSTKVVLVAMACNFGIACAKFFAAAYTGSSAMLSEAIHSLIDTSNQGLLLYGHKRAARPADHRHPFGYSKELYFWSFVVAILLFSLGAGVAIYEGVDKLLDPHPVSNPEVNYIVLGVAIALEGVSAYAAVREFNRGRNGERPIAALRSSKDPALFTVLLEDMAALAGLLIALAGIATAHLAGIHEADGIASIAIGLVLAFVAAFIAIEVKSLLIGEAASQDVIDGIRLALDRESGAGGIRAINHLRTMQLGPEDVLVTASVDFDDGARAGDVEAANRRLEAAIRARFPEVHKLYIEVGSQAGLVPVVGLPAAPGPAAPAETAMAAPKVPPVPSAKPPSGGQHGKHNHPPGKSAKKRKHRR